MSPAALGRVPEVAMVILAAALPRPASAQQQPVANPHVNLHGLACTACHTTNGWHDVRFDHRRTGTPLRGQHAAAPCSGCHDLRDFHTVERQCRFCHQDPHRGDAGLRCEQCHQESGWRQVNPQDAHARSRLPELGVHAALRCADCHRQAAVQQFSGPVTPCAACHQSSFQATTNPSHVALAFSHQCETCHQLTTWNFALFRQHDAIFPVYSGTHAGKWRDCATCHTNAGDYTVFSCTVCHMQGRTDAEHQGMPGYAYQSSACLMCHPTGRGGSFGQHDAIFPIFSGVHAGTWTACGDCHTDPNNRAAFSCVSGSCHPQATTDPAHAGVTGYQFASAQCLSCHPTGTSANFTQHDASYFPIYSGTHAGTWSACVACHQTQGDPSVFTCMSSGCHPQAATDPAHTGIPSYAYTASQCLSCHPAGQAGQFTQHDALYFPIYSGRHAGVWSSCATCHPTPGQPSIFTCMSGSCHPQSQTDSNHSHVTGYAYAATACYTCHPRGTNN
jgi:hypothetical protein